MNAIFGFNSTRIVAVGDNGTILQWDGTSWKRVTSGVTTNLKSVHGISPGTGYAVGTVGTILKTTNSGTSWAPMNSTTTRDLRGVFTFDGNDTFVVGDNISTGAPWLQSDGNTWSTISRSGVDYNWNVIWGHSIPNYLVVGQNGNTVRASPFSALTR